MGATALVRTSAAHGTVPERWLPPAPPSLATALLDFDVWLRLRRDYLCPA